MGKRINENLLEDLEGSMGTMQHASKIKDNKLWARANEMYCAIYWEVRRMMDGKVLK